MDNISSREAQATTQLTVRIAGAQIKKFHGRPAWALAALIDAGARGLSVLERPAPRWAAYIHKLRRAGVMIETLHEHHGGAFSGTHARYRVNTPVEIVERVAA